MNTLRLSQLKIHPDEAATVEAAAERITTLATEAARTRGSCALALAGGSTPRHLYQRLATPPFMDQMPWQAVDVFFGDERWVPPDHPDSNFRMAAQALLDHVPIPASRIHAVPTRLPDPEQAAAAYEQTVLAHLPRDASGVPRFDTVLLGLGTDGHTASLFPGTAILEEHRRLVAPVYVETLGSWRISFTPALINHAASLLFLVTGAAKSAIVARLFGAGEPIRGQPALPVERIRSVGQAEWYADAAAAGALRRESTLR